MYFANNQNLGCICHILLDHEDWKSTSILHHWPKFDWNLSCYACRCLFLLRNTHHMIQGHYICICICENMMSSTKPIVVYNIFQHSQRTDPWPQATCTKNFVKFGRVVLKLCKWADRPTYSLFTTIHRTIPGAKHKRTNNGIASALWGFQEQSL